MLQVSSVTSLVATKWQNVQWGDRLLTVPKQSFFRHLTCMAYIPVEKLN